MTFIWRYIRSFQRDSLELTLDDSSWLPNLSRPRLLLLYDRKEQIIVKRQPLPHPDRPLRVIPQLRLSLRLTLPRFRVRMYENGKRAPVDGEPRDEGAELRRREEVDLEHGDGVRADGLVPEPIDPQLGDCHGCPLVSRSTSQASPKTGVSITYIPA